QAAGEDVPMALDALSGALPTPIAACDRQGRFSYVNAAFAALGGPKREAFPGAAPADVLPAPLARRIEGVAGRARGGEPSRARVAPTPGDDNLDLSCFPIHSHDGEVPGAGCQLMGPG